MNKLILFSLVAGLILSVSCSKNENANSYAAGGALPTNYVSILTKDLPANLQSLGELVDQRFAAGEAYLASQEKAGE